MSSEAASLRCPSCGGASDPEARACPFCGTHLAAVRCPACATLHFAGALLCTRCGVKLREERQGATSERRCPRCTTPLLDVRADALSLDECARCGGVWVDHDTIAALATDPAKRGEARAGAGVAPERVSIEPGGQPIRYVRCPVCDNVMNRKNYGEVSGVIVDVCRLHGVWFDAGELTRVVEFIEKGGLERTRRVRDEREQEARRRERLSRLDEQLRPAASGQEIPFARTGTLSSSSGGLLALLARFLGG